MFCLHWGRTFKQYYWQLLLGSFTQPMVLLIQWKHILKMFINVFLPTLLNISLIRELYICFWAVCFSSSCFIELQLRQQKGLSMHWWHHWRTHLTSLGLNGFQTNWNFARPFTVWGYVLDNVHNKSAQCPGRYLQKQAAVEITALSFS